MKGRFSSGELVDLYIQNSIDKGAAMRITWDEKKNAANQRKHDGIDFQTASLVFDDPYHKSILNRVVDGEERWQTIGMIRGVLLLLVAHTCQDADGEDMVRIISARRVTARERGVYEHG